MKYGRGYDSRNEERENCYGEERALYLQEREARGKGNYIASARSRVVGHERFAGHLLRRTPRSFSTGYNVSQTSLGRPANDVGSGRQRATSPRAFGTVRFASGGQRIENNGSASQKQSAPVPRPAITFRSGNRPPALAAITSSPRVSSAPTLMSPVKENTAPAISAPVPKAPGGSSTSLQFYQNEGYKLRALWYAANPGKETDEHYKKYPDRMPYLVMARNLIAKETASLAEDLNERDAQEYIRTHKERAWMMDVAVKVKHDVEHGTAQVQDHYTLHPEHKDFCLVAQEARPRATLVSPGPVSTVQLTQQASDINGTIEKLDHSKPKQESKISSTINAKSLDTVEGPTISPIIPAKSSSAELERSIPTTHVQPADGSRKADEPPISDSSRTAHIDSSTSTNGGTFDANLYDVIGKFLGQRHFQIDAPVQATMTINARATHLGIEQLADMMENMALAMRNHTRNAENAMKKAIAEEPIEPRRRTIMPGVTEEDIGLYDILDELDDEV